MQNKTPFDEFIETIFNRDGAAGVVECFSFLFGAFVITKDGVVIGADQEFLDLMEYSREELYGMSAFDLIPVDEHERMRRRFRLDDYRRYELKLLPKSKRVKYALVSPKVFSVNNEKYRLAEFIDITEQINLKEKLRLSHEVFSATSDMLADLDDNTVYLTVNEAYANAFGMTEEEFVGRKVSDIFGEELYDTVIRCNVEKTRQGQHVRFQEWLDFPTGGRKYMDIAYTPLLKDDGSYRGFTVSARDITELKRAEERIGELNEQLKQFSYVDGLTGIANRRQFDSTLVKEWQRAMRHGSSLALIMGDIDFFKPYNDNYGHLRGDWCLKTIAGTLDSLVNRSSDLVARFGGEEFVILLPDTTKEQAAQLAEKCRERVEALEIPHGFSSVSDVVTISFGVAALTPSEGMHNLSLVALVDKLLYKAKKGGRNRVECD